MKKIKNKFLKASNQLLALCISLLGFSTFSLLTGCVKPTYDYGVPTAKFIVKGVIQSEDSNIAIPNIQVTMHSNNASHSDANGNYQVEDFNSLSDQTYTINFSDVDGTANREFTSLDTVIEFKNPIFTSGQTEKVFNIKLKPKK